MNLRRYPCPHNRVLTDRELDRIAAAGWSQWKAEQDRKRRQENGPDRDDPDWWKKQ